MAGQAASLKRDLEALIVDVIVIGHPNQDGHIIVAVYFNVSHLFRTTEKEEKEEKEYGSSKLADQWGGREDVLHPLLDGKRLRGQFVGQGVETMGSAEEETCDNYGYEKQGNDSFASAWTWTGLISRVGQSLVGLFVGLTLFVGIHHTSREP